MFGCKGNIHNIHVHVCVLVPIDILTNLLRYNKVGRGRGSYIYYVYKQYGLASLYIYINPSSNKITLINNEIKRDEINVFLKWVPMVNTQNLNLTAYWTKNKKSEVILGITHC